MSHPPGIPARVLVLGCGSVAQCVLPLLTTHVPADRITILDFLDNRSRVEPILAQGAQYVIDRITPENMADVLDQHVGVGDMIIDLAWNIDCCELLQWCHDHGVRYLNTSVEVWDPYLDADRADPRARSLYVRHMDVQALTARWTQPGPTAVLEHGANPGLVSHLTRQALVNIAQRCLVEGKIDGESARVVETAVADRAYNELAMHLGVKVIHIAERDTQITDRPKQVGEFVNTWSVDGLYEEGVAPAELGWGTHERRMPVDAYVHQYGPSNQIALARMGIDTLVHSWTPGGEIIGMIIRHGEAFTISNSLTVWDRTDDRHPRPTYRPTVHYAYCPTDSAWASLVELRGRNLAMPTRQRILNDEIISGADYMGVLLMGHPFRSWWSGSCCTIEEARALVPHQSATTIQVAASINAAVKWMIREPERGVCVPDDLPWEEVLADARPYLGTCFDGPVDWSPIDNRSEANLFGRFRQPRIEEPSADEMWQFHSFLV